MTKHGWNNKPMYYKKVNHFSGHHIAVRNGGNVPLYAPPRPTEAHLAYKYVQPNAARSTSGTAVVQTNRP